MYTVTGKTMLARRWDRPNADALMALAAIEHSRLWAAYWQQQLRPAA